MTTPTEPVNSPQALAAGDFSTWIGEIQSAIRGERDSDVPCGGCTACCTSSQFIHIGPDETDTISHIPAELMFPAPRLPHGHVLLGYDDRGHCPMLIDGMCSIYEHRPRTCRTYDCRVFPAAGLELADGEKAEIARRAQRWQFAYRSDADRTRHEAVIAAARYVREHREVVPDDAGPTNTTQHAVLAIQIHDVFLAHDDGPGRTNVIEPDPEVIRVALARRTGAGVAAMTAIDRG